MSERPRPPETLTPEAHLEWHRICDELDAADRLDKADRAIMVLYVDTWSTYREMMKHVTEFGAIVTFSNGVAGQSPHYKASKECAFLLRTLLSDMGLTPITRSRVKTVEHEDSDVKFCRHEHSRMQILHVQSAGRRRRGLLPRPR